MRKTKISMRSFFLSILFLSVVGCLLGIVSVSCVRAWYMLSDEEQNKNISSHRKGYARACVCVSTWMGAVLVHGKNYVDKKFPTETSTNSFHRQLWGASANNNDDDGDDINHAKEKKKRNWKSVAKSKCVSHRCRRHVIQFVRCFSRHYQKNNLDFILIIIIIIVIVVVAVLVLVAVKPLCHFAVCSFAQSHFLISHRRSRLPVNFVFHNLFTICALPLTIPTMNGEKVLCRHRRRRCEWRPRTTKLLHQNKRVKVDTQRAQTMQRSEDQKKNWKS